MSDMRNCEFATLADAIADALEQALARREAAHLRPLSEASMLSPRDAAAELARLGRDVGVNWLDAQGLIHAIPASQLNGRSRDHRVVIWGEVLRHVGSYTPTRCSTAPAATPAEVTEPEAPASEAVQRAANRLHRLNKRAR